MRRDSEHRLSLSRRIRKCEKLLNTLFPLSPTNAIHWSHCVNLMTVTVEFEDVCMMCQITSTRTFSEACRKVGRKPGDPIWQHSALVCYNFSDDDRPWRRPWDRIEIRKINAALEQLLLEKRAAFPLPKDATAA